jgi:hypothetical protein
MLWHCFVASLGDDLLVLLIYAAGWVVLRQANWFSQPGVRGYALMLVSGLTIAVTIEWIGVYVLYRWAYHPSMPGLPVIEIGIVPVVQMLALPPLFKSGSQVSFWCTAKIQALI